MRWPPWRDPPSSTIIEFDEHGRVIRIPGVYPAPTRFERHKPLILVALAAALFVLVGLLAGY